MADLVLEHDPDETCGSCPIYQPHAPIRCMATGRPPPRPYGEAPDWCPLRSGTVTVRRPSGKVETSD